MMINDDSYTYISVAVNRPLWQSFTYKIKTSKTSHLIGSRVFINFAGSKTIGLISDVLKTPPNNFSKIKECSLLDEDGLISSDVFNMILLGAKYYHYPLGQSLATAIPKILRDGKKCSYEEIPGLCLSEKGKNFDIDTLRSVKQKQLLNILKNGPCLRSQIRERGISSACENALIKKDLIEKIDLKEQKNHWAEIKNQILNETPPIPNVQQQYAIDEISNTNNFKTFVLNGITGSGKTEVYLRIIENVLKKGKAVLVLVPEIALTPQTFDRFYRRFKINVSSMHSALSDRERLDAYIDMKEGNSGILIGTRTALFTPIPNLGLIVIDEEHDSSFRQTDGFRYHTRNLALMRAKISNCPVILGSATPCLETVANYEEGLFQKIDLTIRAGGASLPDFNIIDLCKEPLSDGLRAGICKTLENKIGEETVKGNQVLLFLNRRGYARNLVCHYCGHIFTCPNCDNPLTVHRHDNTLRCHICEYTRYIPKTCPKCGKMEGLLESGFGTEQVEQFLSLRYPDIKVERIDRDTVKNRAQLEEHLERFREKKSMILLGTQMIAKGHDFPDVTLAGILDMDASLFSDDFRSKEDCAQLLLQVSGRAGRSLKKGEVFIQTHYPNDELIKKITTPYLNYWQIAKYLLQERFQKNLPPSSFMAFLLTNSSKRALAYNYLEQLWNKLKSQRDNYPNLQLSPVLSDKMEKKQNRYHFHILVTALNRQVLSDFLDMTTNEVSQNAPSWDVRFAIEVDPLTMY